MGYGPTDGPTDGRTDKASYRDAWTHLKILPFSIWENWENFRGQWAQVYRFIRVEKVKIKAERKPTAAMREWFKGNRTWKKGAKVGSGFFIFHFFSPENPLFKAVFKDHLCFALKRMFLLFIQHFWCVNIFVLKRPYVVGNLSHSLYILLISNLKVSRIWW